MREGKLLTGCELKKCSSFQSQDKLWSDLKNLFSSHLLQLREARKKRRSDWVLFHGPLSPAGSYNTAAALSPWSKADTHPLSAGSTDCHSSCQSTAIYLEAWGLRREQRMERDDDEGGRRGRGRRGKAGHSLQCGYRLYLRFSISISVTERAGKRGTEKQNLRDAFHVGLLWSLLCRLAARVEKKETQRGSSWGGVRSCFDNLPPSLFSPPRPHPLPHSPFHLSNLWSARKHPNWQWYKTFIPEHFQSHVGKTQDNGGY